MAIKKCLIKSNTPQDFSAALSVGGLMIQGSEPANTKRRIVFLVNNVWYKLANNNGTASLVKVPTQNITADSVLNEGNTVAELNAINSIPPFVGRYVYPAAAMYAADGVTTMPSIRLGINYTENLIVDKPIVDEPTVDEPTVDKPTVDKPIGEAPYGIVLTVVGESGGNGAGIWARINSDGEDLQDSGLA